MDVLVALSTSVHPLDLRPSYAAAAGQAHRLALRRRAGGRLRAATAVRENQRGFINTERYFAQ